MTAEETRKMLRLLRTAYPRFYQDLDAERVGDVIDLWREMFEVDKFDHVYSAVKEYIKTEKFPPTIADIYAVVEEKRNHPGKFIQTGTDDAGMPTGYFENRGPRP